MNAFTNFANVTAAHNAWCVASFGQVGCQGTLMQASLPSLGYHLGHQPKSAIIGTSIPGGDTKR